MVPPYRVLVITQQCAYPPMGGGALRVWQFINLLSQQGEVGVLSYFRGQFQPPMHPHAVTWQHCDLDRVKRTFGDKARRRLGRWRRSGHDRVDWLYTMAGAQQLQQVLQTFRPNLIVIAEIWLYRYLPILTRYGCPLILDNHNIEGDQSRYQRDPSKGTATISSQQLGILRYLERRFIEQVNQVWLCSQLDQLQIQRLYPQLATPLKVVPNGIDASFYAAAKAKTLPLPTELPPSPHRLLFLGRYSYEPNAEAAKILLDDIYPALKQTYPDCQVYLVGCDPTPYMSQCGQADSGIWVTGAVADVRPYLAAASVMVVPLVKGSGTRLKLLEAFAAGCPVVSTAKGAEGLAVENDRHLLLRKTPVDMVAAVSQLWQHPEVAERITQQAYQQFLDHYAWPAVGRQMQQALSELM